MTLLLKVFVPLNILSGSGNLSVDIDFSNEYEYDKHQQITEKQKFLCSLVARMLENLSPKQ